MTSEEKLKEFGPLGQEKTRLYRDICLIQQGRRV